MNSAAQAYASASGYIRIYSAGDILRSSVQIYRSNFRTFWVILVLPLLPGVAVQAFAPQSDHPLLFHGANLFDMFVGLLTTAAGTVAVSDICLGQWPSIGRSYRRAFSEMPGKIAGTGLLLWLTLILGLLLLLVPGFIFMLWYLFAIPLVVLEQTSGIAALRRSRHLGRGSYLRNCGVYALLIVPIYVLAVAVGVLFGWVGGNVESSLVHELSGFLAGTVAASFAPVITIAIVLLYYDMRVRKEAYNIQTLAEELRR